MLSYMYMYGGGNMDYIQRMRNLREDNDKTQQQIADYLGTSQTMYARYERGANELPIHHLLALCKYYNVSADYILGLSNIKQISKWKHLCQIFCDLHTDVFLLRKLLISAKNSLYL